MRLQSSWKDYFLFSKRERKVVIGLIVFLFVYGSVLLFYHPKEEKTAIENLDEAIAELTPQSSDSTALQPDLIAEEVSSQTSIPTPVQPFVFDPNTIDENGWKQLGLRDKTIQTIINYRNKGGRFYKPIDLKKIYGLTSNEADRLMPFVKINSVQKQTQSLVENDNTNKNKSSFVKTKSQAIDVNSATVEQWKTLPAIGDVLSNRIVKYRDKIGGFAFLEQVKKVYGLSDSTYQIILPYLRLSSVKTSTANSSSPQKLNINIATADELKANPSIPADVAEAIVIYRRQHGKYSRVDDIKKIVFIKDDLYQIIAPLLTVE